MQTESTINYIFTTEIKLTQDEVKMLKENDIKLIRAYLKDKVNISFSLVAQIRNFKE